MAFGYNDEVVLKCPVVVTDSKRQPRLSWKTRSRFRSFSSSIQFRLLPTSRSCSNNFQCCWILFIFIFLCFQMHNNAWYITWFTNGSWLAESTVYVSAVLESQAKPTDAVNPVCCIYRAVALRDVNLDITGKAKLQRLHTGQQPLSCIDTVRLRKQTTVVLN